MGGAVSDPVYIRGGRYFDGENSHPYVRETIYAGTEYTHILDLTNQEIDVSTLNVMERILLPTVYRFKTNAAIRKAAYTRFKFRKNFLKDIVKKGGRPVCVVYGDNSIGSMEANAEKMKMTAEASKQWWLKLLSQ